MASESHRKMLQKKQKIQENRKNSWFSVVFQCFYEGETAGG